MLHRFGLIVDSAATFVPGLCTNEGSHCDSYQINSRTRGLAPMMMGTLSDEDSNLHAGSDESVESEGGELHRLEIRNGWKVFTYSRHEPSKRKGGGKGKIDKENVSAVDTLVASEQIAEPKLTPMEDHQESKRQKRKVLEIVGMKKQKPHKMCHWKPSIWGPLRYGQTTVKVDGDESTLETTELMPPLPLDSRFNRTETLCGKFRKPGNEDQRDEEDPFFDCWNGEQEQFNVLQQMDPWARNAPKSVPDVKGCFPVIFPVCSVCQQMGVYQRLPIKAPQYDISVKEKTDRATTPVMESGGLMRWSCT